MYYVYGDNNFCENVFEDFLEASEERFIFLNEGFKYYILKIICYNDYGDLIKFNIDIINNENSIKWNMYNIISNVKDLRIIVLKENEDVIVSLKNLNSVRSYYLIYTKLEI